MYYQQNFQPPQGIITLPSEQDALRYPIAPGNSLMFKIENQPLIIEKTMGLSQLDTPQVKYIDLVPRAVEKKPEYATKADLDAVSLMVTEIKDSIESLRKEWEDE